MKQPVARQAGLIIQELPEEVLVYDAENDRAHCLNTSAALVWKYCDGARTAADIAAVLSRELNAPVKEEFVWLALDQLEKESLLEQQQQQEAAQTAVEAATAGQFSLKALGVSRREVIKRIGLASVVALPIVTSLLNPMSAKAGLCNVPCTVGNPAPALCATATAPNCQEVCLSTAVCRPV